MKTIYFKRSIKKNKIKNHIDKLKNFYFIDRALISDSNVFIQNSNV